MDPNTPPRNALEIADTLLGAFATAPTAVISDNLDRLPGMVGLRPFHRMERQMVGRALTVRVPAGDNLYIHKALGIARPGDVVVIDAGGATDRAVIGGIMMEIAQSRQLAGYVIDGAIRDLRDISSNDFPVYARGVIHRGPYKHGPGAMNVPVTVGGQVVQPGDIVVGDEDGVVSFSPAIAEDLLAAVRAQEAREEEIIRSIRAGTYTNAYTKS